VAEKGLKPSQDKEDLGKVLVGNRTSWAVVEAIGKDNVKATRSPVMDAKAIKNEVSIGGCPTSARR
jgi:Xaa-Pro aminopeptidase